MGLDTVPLKHMIILCVIWFHVDREKLRGKWGNYCSVEKNRSYKTMWHMDFPTEPDCKQKTILNIRTKHILLIHIRKIYRFSLFERFKFITLVGRSEADVFLILVFFFCPLWEGLNGSPFQTHAPWFVEEPCYFPAGFGQFLLILSVFLPDLCDLPADLWVVPGILWYYICSFT